ncbi:hypothetical protein [Mycobacteroides salmoniphilum]|uniref:WXG100-like domain-containing protein n=1 Tax=Mycobacteroides salmoniphilum TaxID=404941 RepID=UPI001064F82F|nr:hypothetical protein [Mycobacteroides salmoniphilum]
MSRTLSGYLMGLLETLVGVKYPDGDEDACTEQARKWRQFAADLEALERAVSDGRSKSLEGFASGDLHEKLVEIFQDIPGHVSTMVKQLNGMADSVDTVANTIDDTKTAFYIALVALAAAIVATAWWTFGGGAAVAAAATRIGLISALRWAVSRLIGETATRIIAAIVMRLLGTFVVEAAVAGAVGGLAADLTTQGLQFATGTHPPGGFNWGELGKSVAGGAVMGAVAAPFAAVGAKFQLNSALTNGLKAYSFGTVGNTLGGLAAQPIMEGHFDFGKALAQGAAFSVVDGVAGYRGAGAGEPSTRAEVQPIASDKSVSTSLSPAETHATSTAQVTGSRDAGTPLGSDPPKASGPTVTDPGAGPHTTQNTPNSPAASNPAAMPSAPRAEGGAPSAPRAETPQSNTSTATPTGTRAGVAPTGANPSAAHAGNPTAHVADSAARPAAEARAPESSSGDRQASPPANGEPAPRTPRSEVPDRSPSPAGDQPQPRPANSGDLPAKPAHTGTEPTPAPSKTSPNGLPSEAPRASTESSVPADRAGQPEPSKSDGQPPAPRLAEDLAARTPVDNQAAAPRTTPESQPAAPKTAPDNQPAAPRSTPESQPAAQKGPIPPESKPGARLSTDSDVGAAKQTQDSEAGQNGKQDPATGAPKHPEVADSDAVPAVAPPAMPAIGGEPVARAGEGRTGATPSGARVTADPNRPSSARSADPDAAAEPKRTGTDDPVGEQPRNPSEPLDDVPISKELSDEIRAMEKGDRPPPESYMPQEYINQHVANFKDGASRILLRSSYEEYGIGKPDVGKTEFVLTKDDAAAIIAEAKGDPTEVARKLGIPEDQLAGDSLVIVEFHPTENYHPQMPSGNEWGANNQWLPGGRLPKGDLEAVLPTEGMTKGVDYTVTELEAKAPISPEPGRTEGARVESEAKPPSSEPEAKAPTSSEPARTESARSEELSTGRDSAPEESVASQDHDPSARSEPSVDRDPNEAGRDVASHPDAERAREIANDALWRRDPPVSPDEIRRQLGNDPHNEQRAADNTRWWERLSGEEQRALIDTYPREIGNAEGIPPWAKTEASTHELTRLHDELQARKDAGEHLTRADRKELKRYEGIQKALDDAHSWTREHGGEVNILAFDPHAFGGDGRMVVSVGENPFRADAVSWHVPGYSTTIDKIGGNLENARAHLESVWKEGGTKVSSIAWIGYDAPQGLFRGLWDVAHTKLAGAGGDILHGDITAFNAARDVIAGDGSHFSVNDVFAHSYGTTTTGFAGEGARLGNEVRSVTLAGSPGAGPIGKAADFGVGDKVFVASSSRDPITMLGGRTAESAGRFFGKGLGFDPAMEGFGGQRVTAEFPQHMDHLSGKHGTVSTHTAYYKFDPILGVRTESLANFGRIGAGHFDQVHHEAPRTVDDRPGWQPGWRTDEPAAGRPLQLDHDAGGQYSTDRRIWDPRWHEGYQEPGPGQAIAGSPEPPGPHSPPPHPDVSQGDADHQAGAGEFVEDRKDAAQDAGQIDDAGRVPVEELDSGERTRGWPYDDTGYRIREEDQKFVGIDDTQVGWWQRFEAPLGMTPEQFREFTGTMDEALVADGIDPALADIRLQGSSAQFFSGSHKDFPTEHDLAGQPDALARLRDWVGDRAEGDRPARIPFDAKYLLGVRDENGVLEPPSDYDVQFSSDAMVEKARQAWEAMDPETRKPELMHPKYDFVEKKVVQEAFPALYSWKSHWEELLGREVAPALFGSPGPPDKSGVGSGISTHFRDSDWIINRPGGPRR